jgi:hypothetical protein
MMKKVSTEPSYKSLDLQKVNEVNSREDSESSESNYEPTENEIVKEEKKPPLWWLLIISGIGLFLYRRRG